MGPSIWTAGSIRPVALALGERHLTRAPATDNSFRSALESARSRETPSARAESEPADANDEPADDTADANVEAPSDAETPQPVALLANALVETAAPPLPVPSEPIVITAPQPEAGVERETAVVNGDRTEARIRNSVPTWTDSQLATPPAAGGEEGIDAPERPSDAQPQRHVESASTLARPAPASGVAESDAHMSGAHPGTVATGKQVEPVRTPAPVRKNREAPQEPAAAPPAGADDVPAEEPRRSTAAADANQSAFDRKVRKWIVARREGTDASHSGGKVDAPATVPDEPPVAAGARERGAAAGSPAASIRSARGDAAAILVSRTLVEGGDARADHRSDQGASQVAPTVAGREASASQPREGAWTSARPADAAAGLLAAPSAESVDAVEKAVQAFHSASRAGGRYQATLQLDPPDLGAMRVQVRMHQQAMTLQVEVESGRAHRLVESNLSQLREALAQHGIRVDRADVVVKAPDGQPASFDRPQDGHDRAAQQDGAGRTFDGPGGDSGAASDRPRDTREEAWGGASRMFDRDGAPADGNATPEYMELTWATESSLNLVA